MTWQQSPVEGGEHWMLPRGTAGDAAGRVDLYRGDVRAMLKLLPAESVHATICSPPFWGLRAYGTTPQIWGGDPECLHDWQETKRALQNGGSGTASAKQISNTGTQIAKHPWQQATCERCSAWRGELGSEDSIERFLTNLLEVFREVRRVMHSSAVLCVNLGDSYSGSGKGPTGHNGIGDQAERQGFRNGSKRADGIVDPESPRNRNGLGPVAGIPAKNLCLIPQRFVIAMQADGWIVRSVCFWPKRSAMPESTRDRPTNALEYLFLFSKSPRYYWDQTAIRVANSPGAIERFGKNGAIAPSPKYADMAGVSVVASEAHEWRGDGRNFRNTDPYFLALDDRIATLRAELADLERQRTGGGLLFDGDGLPVVLDVSPRALAEAHFASYPERLVEPFVRAGSSERGVCSAPGCGAPWTRTTSKPSGGQIGASWNDQETAPERGNAKSMGGEAWKTYQPGTTLSWQPTCTHNAAVVPATVMDIFLGSGTTCKVASRLGRSSIGIELSEPYAAIARRLIAETPLFSTPATNGHEPAATPLALFGTEAARP